MENLKQLIQTLEKCFNQSLKSIIESLISKIEEEENKIKLEHEKENAKDKS